MSLTTNLIERLRAYASIRKGELAELITEAADTIELLSAKLHASQMERSSQYYHGGWIPCSERLPEEGQDILAYRVFGDEERIIPANYGNGCWFDCHMNCSVEHIIAWMPLPEPYKGRREEEGGQNGND